MDKIELYLNVDKLPISTIGELKKVISPFTEECKITPLRIYYTFGSDGAIIGIELQEAPDESD